MTTERVKKTALEIVAEWLGTAIVICFLLWAGLLQGQQMQGPTAMPQLNTDYYVGSVPGFYATIQSAVTKACTTSGARVVIPAGSTPSDTIAAVTGGCSKVSIEDRRVAPPAAWTWAGSGPYTLVVVGGGSPVGPLTAIQSKGTSSTFQGSAGAVQDSVGNTYVKSYGGTLDAYINQTTTAPLSYDGIHNSLQTVGNAVTVNQGYPVLETDGITPGEGVINSTGYRSPFCCGGTAIVNPGFATDTVFYDRRYGNLGEFYYNLSPRVVGSIFDLFLNNTVAQSSGSGGTWTLHQIDQVKIGSGKNQQQQATPGSGNWDVLGLWIENQIDLTRGISNGHTLTAYKGQGDYQGFQCYIYPYGDDPDASGEGKYCHRDQVLQDGKTFNGPAAQTYMTGATTLQITGFTGSPPYPYDGDYLVDSTQQSSPFYMTVGAAFNGATQTPGTIVASATFTPDNWGKQTADMASGAVPQQYNGVGTPVTVTVAGFTSTPVTSSPICVGDSFNDESATITNVASYSGGTATFTYLARFWHPAGATYVQGPNQCKFLEVLVNQLHPWRNVVRVLGVLSDTHSIMYSAHVVGSWANQPDGSYSTTNFPSGTVFVRDAFGVVSVAISGAGLSGAGLNGVEFTFNATSGLPSNFYGSFTGTEVDGSSAVVSFSTGVTGAAGSFTSTGPVYHSVDMVEANTGVLMPGAEIVYAGNPSLMVLDGTNLTEPNAMHVASGDTLESQGPPEVITGVSHTLHQMLTPTSASAPPVTIIDAINGRPTNGYIFHEVADFVGPGYFLGDGGLHAGMTYEYIRGSHWSNFWTIDQPISTQGGAVLQIAACPGLTATQCGNTHNFGWGIQNITSPISQHLEDYVNWRGNLEWQDIDQASGGVVRENRWTTANANGTPGTGYSVEVVDNINSTHSETGINSASGAYMYDYLTNAEVRVQPGVVTATAGSGNAVVLTPTALNYGTDPICTATIQPCSSGGPSLTGTNNYTGGGAQNFTGAINQSPATPAISGTNQQSPVDCLTGFYFNVSSLSDQWCWTNTLGAGATPAAVLTLAHTGSSNTAVSIPFAMLFGTVNSPLLTSINATLATSSANANGTPIQVVGNYWNGTASANDIWGWTTVLGAGTNPTTTYTLGHSGSPGTATVNIPFNLTVPTQTSTTNNTTAATTNYVKNLVGISNAVTSATAGTGVTSVTCATAACTNLRGTYTVVGGTATTGVIATLVWPTTTAAYACMITQNGGTSMFALAHSIATATGMTISADLTVAGATFAVDYQCQP